MTHDVTQRTSAMENDAGKGNTREGAGGEEIADTAVAIMRTSAEDDPDAAVRADARICGASMPEAGENACREDADAFAASAPGAGGGVQATRDGRCSPEGESVHENSVSREGEGAGHAEFRNKYTSNNETDRDGMAAGRKRISFIAYRQVREGLVWVDEIYTDEGHRGRGWQSGWYGGWRNDNVWSYK